MTVSTSIQSIPQAVLDAALDLHQHRNTNLIYSPFDVSKLIDAQVNLLWQCVEDRIEFVNLEARNHCAALATFEKLMPLNASDTLFDAAHELWLKEIGHPDSASGRLLGFASKNLNVLMEAAQVIRNKQHQPFDILKVLEVALPHLLGFNAESLVEVIDAQHESTKHDMAAGMIFNALENYLQSKSQIAWDICHITKSKMSESRQSLYSAALQALLHTDHQCHALKTAKEDAYHNDSLIAGPALWTLGRAIRAHKLSDIDLDDCISILTSKTSIDSVEIQQTAIRAIAHAALKDDRLMSKLVQLAAVQGEYTLTVIADFLFMNRRDLLVSSPYFKTLLESLIGLLPSQKRAIDNFDWVLSQLYETPANRSLVKDCLTQWFIQHGGRSPNDKELINLFDQTILQLSNDQPGFQSVITNWLLSPEIQLAVASAGLIDYFHMRGMKSPAFSSQVLDTLNTQDFQFLARRLLGYVFTEEVLLSLTFSLLETSNALNRSFCWVYSLLTNEIGRDYQRATLEALKMHLLTATSPYKELLEEIQKILLQRSVAIDALPTLQELCPPMRLRRAIALNQARAMDKASEVAHEKSILRSLVTEIPVKAGTGWFSVTGNQVGPTQHMQNISYSITLAKRFFTDPVGYAMAGLYYRHAKRDDE